MELTDTHCHIYSSMYKLDADKVIANAVADGVIRMICVGTDVEDSNEAVEFVQNRPNCWASAGIHPHEAKKYLHDTQALKEFEALLSKRKVVAIGECGLDYFYHDSTEFTSPKEDQKVIFHWQLGLAKKYNLPVIFHVRDAFEDFWPIVDQFKGIHGVIHSFTANKQELQQILQRGFYVGLNGIMTFTKKSEQLSAAKAVPLDKLLLETDAPFLTPTPYRGTICEPKHVRVTAEFLSTLRGESLEGLVRATTQNAQQLFDLTKV